MTRHEGSPGAVDGYKRLCALLQEQANVVTLLTQAASEKQRGILERDSAKIEAAVARETELSRRLAELEAERETWLAGWVSARGRTEGDGTAGGDWAGCAVGSDAPVLSDLLSLLPPEQAGPVREAGERLVEALDQLYRINQQNADLIYYSLAHVQTLLGALAGDDRSGGIYGPGGSGATKGDTRPPGLVDWRV